jgi:hypothetical protein
MEVNQATPKDESLIFYPLTFLAEDSGILVGQKELGNYALFPEEAVMLLKQLQQGKNPSQATLWYQDYYGEEVDIEEFLDTLQELKFIKNAGATELTGSLAQTVSWQWLGKVLFSVPAWCIYAMLMAVCLYGLIRVPRLLPGQQDLFFTSSLTAIEIAFFLVQLLAVLFHEMFHTLAGRRLGLPTKIMLGNRLSSLVLETDLTALWTVPRRLRYLPLLAGMLADGLLFATCIIVAWLTLTPSGTPGIVGAFCLAMAYATVLRVIWQGAFYLETDIYYILMTAFKCINLQRTTRAYIRHLILTMLRKHSTWHEDLQWNPRDRAVARWYIFVYLCGYSVSLYLFCFVGIPVLLQLFGTALAHLSSGLTTSPAAFFDAVVFLLLNCLPLLLVGIVVLVKLRKRFQRQQTQNVMNRSM